ncbi:MAG: hypothetical protein OQK45_07825 [Sulfurovum sp.]|nr:hypothetical protein [Sulfurovum sp.]
MLYYYAHSGHKIGLDRVRRGTAFLKEMRENDLECQLLVNDFRAGLAAKDWGGKEYVTIDTIQDIDAIAMSEDSIIIDSDEDDHGRLVKYCAEFKNVWRFEHDPSDSAVHGETLFRADCEDDTCVDAKIVDAMYFEPMEKEERTLFFLNDADYDKIILTNEAFFKNFDMELLLGNYFFVKYEDDLAKLFSTMHEPEEYVDLIKSSTCVVTASAQTALEAKASGAKVIFLNIENNAIYPVALLSAYGIAIVDGFDVEQLKNHLQNDLSTGTKSIQQFDAKKIINKL